MRIDLIRHGQTAWGDATYRDLTERGEAQSRALGRWWAGRAKRGAAPSDVVVGPLARHVQTERFAREAAEVEGWTPPPARAEPLLEEAHAKDVLGVALKRWIEGGPFADDARAVVEHRADKDTVLRMFHEAVRQWIMRELVVGGIEDWPDFRARCDTVADRLADEAEGEHVVALTSGGLIGGVVGGLLGAADEPLADLVFCTWSAHFTSLRRQQGRWVLYRFNAAPHLEAHAELCTHW